VNDWAATTHIRQPRGQNEVAILAEENAKLRRHVDALRFVSVLQALALLCFLLLFAASAVFFTVEADEAWILLSTMKAFGLPVPETTAVALPTLTSGGLHTLVHGGLATFGRSILVHRAVSISFSIGLLGLVFAILRRLPASPSLALAGTALFAAVPGFVLQAGLATAEVMATALMLVGLLVWALRGLQSVAGAVWAGVVVGLACATRVNCVVALAAMGAGVLLVRLPWRDRLIRSCLGIGIAVLLFAIGLCLYVLAFRVTSYGDLIADMAGSTGVGSEHKPWSEIVRYLLISNALLPLFVGVGAAAALVGGAMSHADSGARRFCALLLITAVVGWAAWAWKAPIPHVRYLWPFICCTWLAAVMVLIALVQRTADRQPRLAFHGAVLAVCAYQGLASAFLVMDGESLVLAYQLNQRAPLTFPRKNFSAAADQRAVAEFLAHLPADAKLYAVEPAAQYPLTYLSSRPIKSLQNSTGFDDMGYLVLGPTENALWRPPAGFTVWLAEYGSEAFRSGDNAVYRIRPDAPVPKMQTIDWSDLGRRRISNPMPRSRTLPAALIGGH
jgi:hypothetical protein